jgi:hypothetical protein
VGAVPPGIIVSGTLQRQAWIDRVLPPVEMVRPGLWSIPTPFPDNPLRYVPQPGSTSAEVAAVLVWSRPWEQMLGPQRRFAIGEAYSHLVHLERTGTW